MDRQLEKKRAQYRWAQFEEWNGPTLYDGISVSAKLAVVAFLYYVRTGRQWKRVA